MQHRERFFAAVSHEPVDRPAVDFIAEPRIVDRLAAYLGAVDGEEQVLRRFEVDFRHVYQNAFRPLP